MGNVPPIPLDCWIKFLKHRKCREANGTKHAKWKCPGCTRSIIFDRRGKQIPQLHIQTNIRNMGPHHEGIQRLDERKLLLSTSTAFDPPLGPSDKKGTFILPIGGIKMKQQYDFLFYYWIYWFCLLLAWRYRIISRTLMLIYISMEGLVAVSRRIFPPLYLRIVKPLVQRIYKFYLIVFPF